MKVEFIMVDIQAVLIWTLLVCGTNLILKRALGVGFWDSFTESDKISEKTATVLHFLFIFLSLISCYFWLI